MASHLLLCGSVGPGDVGLAVAVDDGRDSGVVLDMQRVDRSGRATCSGARC